MIFGVDEVGLGAWAGPLVVCAFAAPDENWKIEGLDDSKKLSKKKRESVGHELLRLHTIAQRLVWVDAPDIDKKGIGPSLKWAMEEALENLIRFMGIPERVIIDGEDKGIRGAEFYPKADGKYPAVMAASVLAKVARDTYMAAQSLKYPGYGFEQHVGYGTEQHRQALHAHGLCPLHRRSYEPIRGFGS